MAIRLEVHLETAQGRECCFRHAVVRAMRGETIRMCLREEYADNWEECVDCVVGDDPLEEPNPCQH